MTPRCSSFALVAALALVGCRSTPGTKGDTADLSGDPDADADGDGYLASEDCDDADATTNPGATEICDGIDNDCDDEVDEGVRDTWYADADGDGYGDRDDAVESCDGPAGTVPSATDCDDTDAAVYPSASERCNGVDDDCDGAVDEDVRGTWFLDADGDGYGDPGSPIDSCDPPEGAVDNDEDCDDTAARANPDGIEVCDRLDNDCDGRVDEEAEDAPTWYADVDGDGYGDPLNTTNACETPTGYVDQARDCDDGDFDVRPDADERCDGIDNDCDGQVDDADPSVDPTTGSTWYADADRDGFGDAAAPVSACLQPSGAVTDATDCDDTTAAVSPAASEVCNGVDDDCDGLTDDADGSVDRSTGSTWYLDADTDGYGDASAGVTACSQPSGTVTDATDCNDAAASINPGATEVCNAVDDDCDGLTDDADSSLDPSTGTTFYADTDGDGYGDPSSTLAACTRPSGYDTDALDCDDTDPTVNPDGDERCDGVDNDCDGATDELSWTQDFASTPSSSVFSINGSAHVTGGYLELTGLNGTGTAFWSDPFPGDRWHASFDLWTGGGSGADGLAFVFLTTSDPTVVGGSGGSIGYRGLTGTAVELDTYFNGGVDPNGNHLAVVDAASFSNYATSTSIPTLEDAGWFTADVYVDGTHIEVDIDGTTYITATLPAAATEDVLMGVSAATGGSTNYHRIDDLTVECW